MTDTHRTATTGSTPTSPAPLLEIRDLHVKVAGQEVLRGISLTIGAGEVHAIMGPNGSGKSTLSHVLAGRPGYQIVSGSVSFEGRDLLALAPEQRARAGLFLGFQYPVEIPGVNNAYLLKAAVNASRRERGLAELDAFEFLALVRTRIKVSMRVSPAVKRSATRSCRCWCWSPGWHCSTRPIRVSTSMR